MPMVMKTKYVHLFDGLLHRPMILRDAIGGDHHAGAVAPKPTVDENPPSVNVPNKRKKLRDLLIGWRRPATYGNVNETKTEGFRTFALRNDIKPAAEIDNSSEAKLLELNEARRAGLRASKKYFADLSSVRNARDGNFPCVDSRWSGSALRSSCR